MVTSDALCISASSIGGGSTELPEGFRNGSVGCNRRRTRLRSRYFAVALAINNVGVVVVEQSLPFENERSYKNSLTSHGVGGLDCLNSIVLVDLHD